MKKLFSIFLMVALLCFCTLPAFASVSTASESPSTQDVSVSNSTSVARSSTYVDFTKVLYGNYYDSFTVGSNCTVNVVAAARYVDGSSGNVTVTVGNQSFTLPTDGTSRKLGTVSLSAGPCIYSVTGINGQLAISLNIYSY